jgi:hypothetical protein
MKQTIEEKLKTENIALKEQLASSKRQVKSLEGRLATSEQKRELLVSEKKK